MLEQKQKQKQTFSQKKKLRVVENGSNIHSLYENVQKPKRQNKNEQKNENENENEKGEESISKEITNNTTNQDIEDTLWIFIWILTGLNFLAIIFLILLSVHWYKTKTIGAVSQKNTPLSIEVI